MKKFVHLSDLHIGKTLNEFLLEEDQTYILNQIVDIARRENVDGVIIAGDVFDTQCPSGTALRLYRRFLTGLVGLRKSGNPEMGIYITSGNHDQAVRLTVDSEFLRPSGIYMSHEFDSEPVSKHTISDGDGEIDIYLLPYIEPAFVKDVYPEEAAQIGSDCTKAMQCVISHMGIDPAKRNILVAHQTVWNKGNKPQESGSENLNIGGLDCVDAEVFEPFDYVALGHIHRPQNIVENKIRYCGSPLKYSAKETSGDKSVTIVTLTGSEVSVREVPLVPLRDVKKIKGSFEELNSPEFYNNPENVNCEDFIVVELTDDEIVYNAKSRLQIHYPRMLHAPIQMAAKKDVTTIGGVVMTEGKSDEEIIKEILEAGSIEYTDERKEWIKGLIANSTKEEI